MQRELYPEMKNNKQKSTIKIKYSKKRKQSIDENLLESFSKMQHVIQMNIFIKEVRQV